MREDDGRLHPRINVTPASLIPEYTFTVANLHMLRLNAEMAWASGGTLIFQFEDLFCQNMSIQYRNDRRAACENVLRQASHYGIVPSSAEELEANDIPGKYRVMYQSDTRDVFEAIWRNLLPYRDRLPGPWKDWPGRFPERAHGCPTAVGMPGIPNGVVGFRGMATGLAAYRVIDDMVSRRNVFINGSECQHYKGTYNDICLMLGIPPPLQLTAPLLRRRKADGTVEVIGTSAGQAGDFESNPYHVEYAMNAGVTYQELWDFIGNVVFTARANINFYGCFTSAPTQLAADGLLHQYPVIDDAAWIDVVETAKARQAKIANATVAEPQHQAYLRKRREQYAKRKKASK